MNWVAPPAIQLHFRPNIALVTGYELGKITTWNLGMRFSF